MANKLLKRLNKEFVQRKFAEQINVLLDKLEKGDLVAEEKLRSLSQRNDAFRNAMNMEISKRMTKANYAHVEVNQFTTGMRPVRK